MNKLTGDELLEHQINVEFKILQSIANQSECCEYLDMKAIKTDIDLSDNAYDNVERMLTECLYELNKLGVDYADKFTDIYNVREIYKEMNYCELEM